MAEASRDWRAMWDSDCPLSVGVSFAGWEAGSDAALRDELTRIRDTGFQTVRVRFDRDGDIEKMAGLVNWRNPDRFFDGAQQAGLRVIAAPGNRPHRSFTPAETTLRLSEAGVENVAGWLRRFCGQYREHPALLAWVMEEDPNRHELGPEQEALSRRDNLIRLLNAFHAADPSHPVLSATSALLADANAITADGVRPDLFGAAVWLDRDLEMVNGEMDRPLYALSRITTDMATRAYPVLVDCTGGTSRTMGARAFTMTEGKMTRLLLLFLAAGMRSICLETWKPEIKGASPGESGMLDWLDRVTPPARAAGRIAQAVERHRQELWHSTSRPNVHILWTPASDPLTLIGAARTLLNANTPFAFLTETQLLTGSVPPAPILFLPGMETLSTALLARLTGMAQAGTRVVADMPCGYLNENGALLDTRPGSAFEQLFGASIAGLFCFPNPNLKETETGRGQQKAELVPTTAQAGGMQADGTLTFTENRVGKGRALLVNLSLSRLNAAPNLSGAQLSLLSYILGSKQTALPALSGCLIFRRASEQAEHVFLVNDSGEERTVEVALSPAFSSAGDALDDALNAIEVENGKLNVVVPAGSGRWLRLGR